MRNLKFRAARTRLDDGDHELLLLSALFGLDSQGTLTLCGECVLLNIEVYPVLAVVPSCSEPSGVAVECDLGVAIIAEDFEEAVGSCDSRDIDEVIFRSEVRSVDAELSDADGVLNFVSSVCGAEDDGA